MIKRSYRPLLFPPSPTVMSNGFSVSSVTPVPWRAVFNGWYNEIAKSFGFRYGDEKRTRCTVLQREKKGRSLAADFTLGRQKVSPHSTTRKKSSRIPLPAKSLPALHRLQKVSPHSTAFFSTRCRPPAQKQTKIRKTTTLSSACEIPSHGAKRVRSRLSSSILQQKSHHQTLPRSASGAGRELGGIGHDEAGGRDGKTGGGGGGVESVGVDYGLYLDGLWAVARASRTRVTAWMDRRLTTLSSRVGTTKGGRTVGDLGTSEGYSGGGLGSGSNDGERPNGANSEVNAGAGEDDFTLLAVAGEHG